MTQMPDSEPFVITAETDLAALIGKRFYITRQYGQVLGAWDARILTASHTAVPPSAFLNLDVMWSSLDSFGGKLGGTFFTASYDNGIGDTTLRAIS